MHQDGYAKLKYDYSYDSIGRLIRTDISDSTNGTAVGSTEYGYNTRGHLIYVANEIGGKVYNQHYSYSDTGVTGALANAQDGLPTRYTTLGVNTDYSYDGLNRLTLRSVKVSDTLNLNNAYTYMTTNRNESGKTYATTRLATETIVGVPYGYTYSNMGDIMSITRSGDAYKSYTYDALGEMRSETQHTLNRKSSYTYDSLGNILTKTTVNTNTNANISSITYGYGNDNDTGWNKLLTSLTFTDYTNSSNNRTETIDYDEIGNPLSYRGATMSWFGRQMRTYSKGSVSANFMYDADGLRSAKGVNGVKTTYQYVGDKLYYEKIGNDKILYYFYDSYGDLANIYYTYTSASGVSGAIYHVATNAQGDVIALYNFAGKKVGAYDYDAWGNTRVFVVTQDSDGNNIHTQIDPETQYLNHIVNVNPIRYRGYYYDSDLDLYYLQSRYYDSEIGRFINADGYITTGQGVLSYNMYSYCLNNPIMSSDNTGQASIFSFFKKIVNCAKTIVNNNSVRPFFERLLDSLTSTKEYGNTCSIGVTYGYTSGGVSVSKSKVISSDTSYNYAKQETESMGASIGAGGSAGFTFSVTDANNVYDLNGESTSWGCTFNGLIGVSIEFSRFIPNSNPEKVCHGFGFALSFGGEFEIHKYDNMTTTEDTWHPLVRLKEKLYG